MPRSSDHWSCDQCRQLITLVRVFYRRSSDAIISAAQRDRRNVDLRPLRETLFHLDEPRLARRIADAMTIKMNHKVYEIEIIEKRSRAVECLVRKVPSRRPRLPQEPADCPPVHLQSCPTAFRIEIILIPDAPLGRRGGWR